MARPSSITRNKGLTRYVNLLTPSSYTTTAGPVVRILVLSLDFLAVLAPDDL